MGRQTSWHHWSERSWAWIRWKGSRCPSATVVSTPDAQIASLEAELSDARDEAELNLLLLQQVQEELEHYFLRCQELSSAEASAAPRVVPELDVASLRKVFPLVVEHVTDSDLFTLAQVCDRRGHHKLALVLFDAVVSRASSNDPTLAAQAQLQAVLARLALGRVQGAERLLSSMADQPLPDLAVRHQVRQHLARIALGRGDTTAAQQHLTALAELPAHDASGAATALLQGLLAAHATQPGPIGAATLLPTAEAPGLSLDRLCISPCGRLLQLDGWLIDPAQQLQALALQRPGHILPLPLEQLSRRVRSDLSHLLADHGLPADHAAGFTLTLALADEEAVAPTAGEPATLHLLRAHGTPLAVSSTVAVATPTAASLLPLLGPWLLGGTA